MKTKLILALTLVAVLSLLTMATASAALPPNMSWVKYASNPVVNNTQCYSADHVKPAFVFESSNNYKMYISPRGVQALPPDIYLLTTSNGGLNWSCANGSAPVLSRGASGAWDDTRVEFASVLKEGPTDYKMWYSGRNSSAVWGIGYAFSTDGIAWTKYGGNPVLTGGAFGAWDSLRAIEPTVIKVGSNYHMWYTGEKVFPYSKIGHATAANPQGPWTKDAGNPVVAGTPNTWDANQVYSPYVVPNPDGSYEMFYSGENGDRWLTGHANGTLSGSTWTWTKDANAILSPSSTGWEAGADSLDYAGAVLDGSTWKVFYSLGGTYQVGLATLQNTAQLTFNPLATSVAVGSNQVVTIDLTSVTSLYGYQFQVNYNSSIVSASLGGFDNSFFDTTGQFVPSGWDGTCAAGVCKFAVSKTGLATAVGGSGTLAHITFTGVAPGLTTLTFTSDILSNKDAVAITHTANTGWLTVYNTAAISGVVALQGRATPINAGTVSIYDENGVYPVQTVPFNATTGVWTATVATGGTYDLVAEHSLYLSNRLNGVTTLGAQALTTLKGGDATNDGKIDVGDLSCVGGDFGGAPGTCGGTGSSDINADGTVNILDLVLVGGNYALNAPQPW